MRELDLLFKEFSETEMLELSNDEVRIFKNILNYDDQTLYDFIFKKLSLGNIEDENFVNKKLKKFTKLKNF